MFSGIKAHMKKINMYINFVVDKIIRWITLHVIRFMDHLLTATSFMNTATECSENEPSDSKIEYIIHAHTLNGKIYTTALNYILSELKEMCAPLTDGEIKSGLGLLDTDTINVIIMSTEKKMYDFIIPMSDSEPWIVNAIQTKRPMFGNLEKCI